jgi:hypothetical protein
MKTSMTRAFLTSAVVLAGALTSASPAQAATADSCEKNPPTATAANAMMICTETTKAGNEAWGSASVRIGSNWGTAATACKITTYLNLTASFDGDPWQSTRVTQSCDWALDHRGSDSGQPQAYTKTNAVWAQAVGCVDLYYGSTHSGWQWCSYGTWIKG